MAREKKQRLKKRKDGRFACRYKGIWFYGDSDEEALNARTEYKRLEAEGLLQMVNGPTVRQYASKWLPLHKSGVSEKTYNDYAKQIDALISCIGSMPISKVTVDDAKSVYTSHYAGYSESTVKRAKMLFVDLFDAALENDLCKKNPFRSKKAQPDKGEEGSHRAITPEERKLILETEHPFRAAVMVMLYAGLRRGEALALSIDEDVDAEACLIHVRHAVRFDSNQPILTDPKTEAGEREVALFSILKNELKGKKGLLAPSKKGKLMSESAFTSAWHSYIHTVECRMNGVNQKRWYGRTREHKKRIEQAAELRKRGMEEEARKIDLPPWQHFTVRPHDLRHSYCTMLRDAGVDMKQAMIWMGHADEKMILQIYDHPSDERYEKSTQQVENLLIGSQNGSQKPREGQQVLDI